MPFGDVVPFLVLWFRDIVPFLVLCGQLPIPLFWLVVHPAIGFWRRHPRACYYLVTPSVWLLVAVALVVPRHWWLAERFSRHWLVAVAGAALIVADLWLMRQVKRDLHWRVLVGLPELMLARWSLGVGGPDENATGVVTRGVYERVRHPRYAGMMLAWLGAVLLSGATRLLVLVAVFIGLALLVTEFEERELLKRLGEDYADYRRRVPRLIPRWRQPGTRKEDVA